MIKYFAAVLLNKSHDTDHWRVPEIRDHASKQFSLRSIIWLMAVK